MGAPLYNIQFIKMARYINLKLINTEGIAVAYPGILTSFQVGTDQSIDEVYVGVSADGNTNQVYPITTPLSTILLSWPRIYKGISITTLSGITTYLNSLQDFNLMVANCCAAILQQDSDSEGCMVSFLWVHNTGAGNMIITVDGEEVVNSGVGSGSFQASAAANINVVVEGGTSTNELTVEDNIDGVLYTSNNGSGEFGEDYTFNPVCGRIYTLTGTTTPGE